MDSPVSYKQNKSPMTNSRVVNTVLERKIPHEIEEAMADYDRQVSQINFSQDAFKANVSVPVSPRLNLSPRQTIEETRYKRN